MFFGFIALIVLLTMVLTPVLAIVAFPIGLLVALAGRGRDERHNFLGAAATQVLVCLALGGIVALTTTAFIERNDISVGWLYTATAFFIVFMTLGYNAVVKRREATELTRMFDPTVQGTVQGAAWGFYGGLALFVVAMVWPTVVSFIPGASWLIEVTVTAAAWLTQFWPVRAIAAVCALGYLLYMGLMVLCAGMAVVGAFTKKSAAGVPNRPT